MDIWNKLRIIYELFDAVKMEVIKAVKDMPEDWDGMELRWFVSERFKDMTVDPTARPTHKKRYKEYRNTVITKGL